MQGTISHHVAWALACTTVVTFEDLVVVLAYVRLGQQIISAFFFLVDLGLDAGIEKTLGSKP